MDIKKIFAKIKRERAELFKADISDNSNLSMPNQRVGESAKEMSEDKQAQELQLQSSGNIKPKSEDVFVFQPPIPLAQCQEEKPRRKKIDSPPNCYDDSGKIKAHFGTFTYAQIYSYTGRKLVIKDNGGRRMPCTKCSINTEYKYGLIGKNMKQAACYSCRGNFTYLDWANTNAQKIRHNLYMKGLLDFADKNLALGYDVDEQKLIFPLNKNLYVELGFDGREFTQSKKECMSVLMHYNREMIADEKGGFKPMEYRENLKPYAPYLDNKFYSSGGEIVIAGCAAYPDNGTKAQSEGKLILPFPL